MLIFIPDQKLSTYFKMYEVEKSSTANRLMIDNTPTTPILKNAQRLAKDVLDPIRDNFNIPFSPNSWFRCEDLEKTITKKSFQAWCSRKGKPINDTSWKEYFSLKSHPTGEAADIEIPGISNDELFTWIKKNINTYDQLIREFPKPNNPTSGWVHVSLKYEDNRKQDFTIG